jgi:hypothetical protein
LVPVFIYLSLNLIYLVLLHYYDYSHDPVHIEGEMVGSGHAMAASAPGLVALHVDAMARRVCNGRRHASHATPIRLVGRRNG